MHGDVANCSVGCTYGMGVHQLLYFGDLHGSCKPTRDSFCHDPDGLWGSRLRSRNAFPTLCACDVTSQTISNVPVWTAIGAPS